MLSKPSHSAIASKNREGLIIGARFPLSDEDLTLGEASKLEPSATFNLSANKHELATPTPAVNPKRKRGDDVISISSDSSGDESRITKQVR